MAVFSSELDLAWPRMRGEIPSVFTTQNYVEILKRVSPETWKLITDRYGPGGKGSGSFYSPANPAFNYLKQKANEGVIFRRQFVDSQPGWGSPVVAEWEWATSTSSLPPEEGDLEFVEGHRSLRWHLAQERNIGLRPQVLRRREKLGLACDCCGRAEPRLDIELQRAMFEVHHKSPLADGFRKTKLQDVELLCATCHRLLHGYMRMHGKNIEAAELATKLRLQARR